MTPKEQKAREALKLREYEIIDNEESHLFPDVFLPDGPCLGALSVDGLLHLAELERVKALFDDLQAILRQVGNVVRQAEQIS